MNPDSEFTSGIFHDHFDPSVKPQTDFFRYVNGSWLKNFEIPDDRSGYGSFTVLREESEAYVHEIIDDLSKVHAEVGSNSQKIGDLYRSFMDEERIEALGTAPIQKDIDRALKITSAADLLETMGNFEARGNGGLFYLGIEVDAHDSNRYISYLAQGGISLPDEAYYREEQYASIREAFLKHIEKMLTLAGIADAPSHAARVLELETKIAANHFDQVKDRDMSQVLNSFTFGSLKELTPGFNWQQWMSAALVPEFVLSDVIVQEPTHFSGFAALLSNFDREAWSSWLLWHLLSGTAPFLSKSLVEENFDFYGRTLSGTPQLRERWKRGVALVEGALGEAIGQEYVARHFPPSAKERMVHLVANLIEAYRKDISKLSWMTDETKAQALAKLAKFTPKIGYPDKWRDYSKLTIVADDLMANLEAVTTFGQNFAFAKIGTPIDRQEWGMTPQTVNAYYHPLYNEVVFPAAILQPPFFDLKADDAVNYGGIGAVIGHEIGHGFDDQGSKFDGDGNLNNWWSETDRIKFEELTKQLIDQYDALSPTSAPDLHVNGALTIGENIGDLGGAGVAFEAYQLSLAGNPAPVIDGLTGEQRFFIGYAQIWNGKLRPEEVRRRIATDPHSPEEFRCNQILKNVTEFYSAFGVEEGDALFLPESQRVRIW
jgi:putative endopeptidase